MKLYKQTEQPNKISKEIQLTSIDEAYLQILVNTLNEWESEYDKETYKNLQNIK